MNKTNAVRSKNIENKIMSFPRAVIGQATPDVKISAVIPEGRNRGSSTHPPFRNTTTNNKRGRFPIETLGNDLNLMGRFLRGFTLIELLVVVLIVGILAAIAVPQYQKAVEKSRMTQHMITVRALYNALERYRLANGAYPPAKDNQPGATDISYFNDILDIDIKTDKKLSYYPNYFIQQGQISINWALGGGPGNGQLTCGSGPTTSTYEKYKRICLSLCSDKQWRTWPHGEYCLL